MKKALLVVNPSSGGEQAQEYEKLAHQKLTTMFDEVVVLHTKKAGDAKNFTREAAVDRYHSVSWVEMVLLMKESMGSLNKHIVQILVLFR